MKARRVGVIACAVMLSALVAVSAHPGRTDSSGGHYNRSTGEYHYHHGYPEHQHTNGVCPYDYDDKTGEGSGGNSDGGTSVSNVSVETLTPTVGATITPTATATPEPSDGTFEMVLALLITFGSPVAMTLAVGIITAPFYLPGEIHDWLEKRRKK